jgi:hypothetical protein
LDSWVVFYEHGTFSSADGEPEESPPFGAVAVVVADRHSGQRVLTGEFFLHIRGQWMACVNEAGLYDQLAHFGHTMRAFRPGRWIEDSVYQDILRRAGESGVLPGRSARSPYERQGW